MQPIYVSFVFWGDKYLGHVADYLLPCLMSPGNLPALAPRPVKVLIATTAQDWSNLQRTAQFEYLKTCAEPELIEIPPPPPDLAAGCLHMGKGHVKIVERALADGAYLSALSPDMVISDGAFALADRKAREGCSLVLATGGLRTREDGFLPAVRAAGGIEDGVRLRDHARSLNLGGRNLVRATMNNLHSEGQAWGFDQPALRITFAPYWKVKGREAWVMHSMHWMPLLLDYSKVQNHDMSALIDWTMDGDYLHDNFGQMSDVYIVRSSDEVMLAGWAPAADRPWSLDPAPGQRNFLTRNLMKAAALHYSLHGPFGIDDTKKRLFTLPIRWSTEEVGEDEWRKNEKRVDDFLQKWGIYSPQQGKKQRSGTAAVQYATLTALRHSHRLLVVALLKTKDVLRHANFLRRHYAAQGPAHVVKYFYLSIFAASELLNKTLGVQNATKFRRALKPTFVALKPAVKTLLRRR